MMLAGCRARFNYFAMLLNDDVAPVMRCVLQFVHVRVFLHLRCWHTLRQILKILMCEEVMLPGAALWRLHAMRIGHNAQSFIQRAKMCCFFSWKKTHSHNQFLGKTSKIVKNIFIVSPGHNTDVAIFFLRVRK